MKVTINKATLASIYSLSVGASKDDITPVITQIALTREGESLRAMTTDRYIVVSGRYDQNIEFEDWAEDETILIDPKLLKPAVDMTKSDKMGTTPIVIDHDREVKATKAIMQYGMTVIDIGRVKGSFPPVMKLFPKGTEPNGAPVLALKPDFLGKLAKVLPPVPRPDKERVWAFEFRTDEGSRPSPVYAVYSDAQSYQMEALLQPNLLQR
jgi:hypothetical protein